MLQFYKDPKYRVIAFALIMNWGKNKKGLVQKIMKHSGKT